MNERQWPLILVPHEDRYTLKRYKTILSIVTNGLCTSSWVGCVLTANEPIQSWNGIELRVLHTHTVFPNEPNQREITPLFQNNTSNRLSHESTLRVNRCLKRQCSVRSHQFSDHGGPQRGEMLRWHAQQQHSEEQEHLSVEDGHLRQTQTLHQTLWAQIQTVKLNGELVLLRQTSSCSIVSQ